jgi:DNA-binding XRE family transcriptional regulator
MLLIVCSLFVYAANSFCPIMTDGNPKDTHNRRVAFGNRIRTLRESRHLSQESLAELADLHRTYVSSVERGQRNIGLDNIFSLADALGVPAAELFRDP